MADGWQGGTNVPAAKKSPAFPGSVTQAAVSQRLTGWSLMALASMPAIANATGALGNGLVGSCRAVRLPSMIALSSTPIVTLVLSIRSLASPAGAGEGYQGLRESGERGEMGLPGVRV